MADTRIWFDMVVCGPCYLIIFWTGIAILFAYLLGRCG